MTRVCVMWASGTAESATDEQAEAEEALEQVFEDSSYVKLVAHSKCVASGRRLRTPERNWFRAPYVGKLARGAGADIVVLARLATDGRRVRLAAVDAESGQVMGHATISVKHLARGSSAAPRWAQRQKLAFDAQWDEDDRADRLDDERVATPRRSNRASRPSVAMRSKSRATASPRRGRDESEEDSSDEEQAEDLPRFDSGDAWETVTDDGFAPIDVNTDTTGAASIDVVSSRPGSGLTWEGFVSLDATSFMQPNTSDGRRSGELFLKGKWETRQFDAVASVQARRDVANESRDRVGLYEGYAVFRKDTMGIRAGRLLVTWGATSLVSVADVMNPRDLRDPLLPEKLPTVVAIGRLSTESLTVEAYFLPKADRTLFPGVNDAADTGASGNPWVPMGQAETLAALTSEPDSWTLVPQGGARLYLSTNGWDLEASYSRLIDRLPVAAVAAPMRLLYRPQNLIAVSAERALGKLRLAGEGLLTLNDSPPEQYLGGANSVAGVVGIDYRTRELGPRQFFHWYLELYGLRTISGPADTGFFAAIRRPFTEQLLARVVYRTGDMSFSLDAAGSLRGQDFLVRPSVNYVVDGRMSITLSGEFLGGDGSGFYGQYSENSRVRVSARVFF